MVSFCWWLRAAWQDMATRAQSRKDFQLHVGAVLSVSLFFSRQASFVQYQILD